MIKKKAIGLCIMIAFMFMMFSCNNDTKNKDQKQVEQKDLDTTKTSKQVTAAYQCKMKCEGTKTYAQAGKCPECGMDLVKVQ